MSINLMWVEAKLKNSRVDETQLQDAIERSSCHYALVISTQVRDALESGGEVAMQCRALTQPPAPLSRIYALSATSALSAMAHGGEV